MSGTLADQDDQAAHPHKAGAALPLWRERLFATMTSNTVSAARDFLIPSGRVIELGTQVEL